MSHITGGVGEVPVWNMARVVGHFSGDQTDVVAQCELRSD